jgi:hypothetical protein
MADWLVSRLNWSLSPIPLSEHNPLQQSKFFLVKGNVRQPATFHIDLICYLNVTFRSCDRKVQYGERLTTAKSRNN